MADNATTIADFLLGKGLTREQVAGILGNLKIESGYNPAAFNANEGAIGIAQWEGGRRARLQAYAAQVGGRETDLTVQLGFLWHELTGSEIKAMHALAVTTTPGDAAAAFDQTFERSSGAARSARIAAANAIYPKIGPGAGDAGFSTSGGGQAFRGQAGALQDAPSADGGSSGPSLWGGSWLSAIIPGYGAVDAATNGNVAGTVLAGIGQMLLPVAFVIGGVGLVIGGLIVAAKPAATKALSLAADLK